MKYIPQNNVYDFIRITNNKKWIFDKYNEFKDFNNSIEIDYVFYNLVNRLNVYGKRNNLIHLHTKGIENGLIYHPKQLLNIYENLDFEVKDNNIILKNTDTLLHDFIKMNVYEKNYNFFLNHLVKLDDNNINYNKDLVIIAFIGDIENGILLIQKINEYKKIQDFNLCIVYHKSINISEIKNLVKNDYIYFKSNEFGNDIIPSLLAYDLLRHVCNFKYIIKIHTKSDFTWFNDTTNFLFSKPVDEIKLHKNNNCNCISHPEYIVWNKGNQNTKLMKKYIKILNYTYFVKGSIFFCDSIIFDKILNFVKENHKPYLFNNMYDTNCINESNSPVHFLERLFGMIE